MSFRDELLKLYGPSSEERLTPIGKKKTAGLIEISRGITGGRAIRRRASQSDLLKLIQAEAATEADYPPDPDDLREKGDS